MIMDDRMPDQSASQKMPVVTAKITHTYEYIIADLADADDNLLKSFHSQTFFVDSEDILTFDPKAELQSLMQQIDGEHHVLNNDNNKYSNYMNNKNNNNNNNNNVFTVNDANNIPEKQNKRANFRYAYDKPFERDLAKLPPRRSSQPLNQSKHASSLTRKNSMRRKDSFNPTSTNSNKLPVRKPEVTRNGSSLFSLAVSRPSKKDQPVTTYETFEPSEKEYDTLDLVLRKDGGGFGLTLHGQNPVSINSVKESGVAARNGVQVGDIIFKINGDVVVRESHESVVNLFHNAGPFLALTIKRPTIRDIKSFEDDDDDEEVPEHIEFEDLSLLKQSPLHAAVFIKYLINNSDPAAMLFTTIAGLYRTTTSKDQSILQKWAAEIFITFLDDNAPLPVQTSCVDSIRNSVASKDAIQKDIFESAIASIEEKVQEQLREYQGKRQIGLGTLFGDSYLPPPTKNASFSNRSIKNQSQSNIQTAPVNFSKPPLSQTPPSNKSNGSNSSVSSDSHRPPSAHYPLSSSSFTSSSLPFNSNTLSKLHKSPSINTPSTPYNYDISNLEKILWEDLQQNADSPDDWKLAIAICIATIFRNTPGLQISRANSFLFENFPAFLCKDKRALKNRMKKVNYKGHQFTPHQCHPLQRPKCSTCLEVVWSIGYQVYTCSACRCTIHGKCLKLVHECAEARKFHKDPNKLSSPSIFYTAEPLSDYDIHRRAVGTPCISSPQPPTGHNSPTPVYSDSDFEVESELPSLSNTILNETLANMDVKSRKYQEVINELFYTERSHLKTLKIMDKEILRPMRADSKISQSLVDLLFPNLEKIIEIHKDISTAFKARKEQGKVVESVGDILYEKFSGEKGEMLQQECAEFCKDQYYSLEALRQCQNKDAYLAQFIQNMAQKRICRKLELKDFLPKVMQRLTKYPLLIEHLLKNSPEDTEEHQQLSLALKSVKVILSHVNQVVRDCENYRRTQEMQRRLDAKGIEGINHPVLLEYNNLNLTEHKMVFEGELQWYQNDLKSTSLLLVLFEDILVILQKVEHKLLLKCQNAMRGGLENSKYMQVPIIKLSHLMTKDIPRENKSFYLVSASREDSQMYKLVARSTEERNRWTRHIKEAVENYRNQYSASPRSNNNNNNKQENNININNNNNNNNSFNDNEDKKSEKLSKKHSLESGTNHEQFESSYESRMDNDKGAKDEEEEEEDEDDTIVDHTASVCNPEDELKRQIVVTHELMIDKITTLSNMHNIVSKHLTQSLPLNLDSATFIRSMHRIIDKMTKFFEEELPIEVINDVTDAGKALEWDPVESLVELGTRLEMYVRQLESLVTKNKVLKQYSNQPQPPPPLSPPPSIEQETL